MAEYPLHTVETAPEGSKETLRQVEQKFGFVPNLTKVLATSPAALRGYVGIGGAFDGTTFTDQEKQVVLLSVSWENGCDYCMAAHSKLAELAGLDASALEAVRTGGRIADAKLEALHAFTRHVVRERGRVGEAELESFQSAGYDRSQVLEVVLGVAMKTLSNYTNHVAGTPVDDAFAEHRWAASEAGAIPG